jgi:hypothetical protein
MGLRVLYKTFNICFSDGFPHQISFIGSLSYTLKIRMDIIIAKKYARRDTKGTLPKITYKVTNKQTIDIIPTNILTFNEGRFFLIKSCESKKVTSNAGREKITLKKTNVTYEPI